MVIVTEHDFKSRLYHSYEMAPKKGGFVGVVDAETIAQAAEQLGLTLGVQKINPFAHSRQSVQWYSDTFFSDGTSDRVFGLVCVDMIDEMPLAM